MFVRLIGLPVRVTKIIPFLMFCSAAKRSNFCFNSFTINTDRVFALQFTTASPCFIHYFVCANNKVDYRGECPGRHYVRADAVEQVVMLELRRMAEFLAADEEAFAELLAQKTDKELLKEKKHDEAELQKAIVRNDTVSHLY